MIRLTVVTATAALAAAHILSLWHPPILAAGARRSASTGTLTISISVPVELEAQPGSCCSQAWGVNNAGHAVGFSTNALGGIDAILWTTPATPTNIGSLGGTINAAYAISDVSGGGSIEYVTGVSRTSTAVDHVYRWDAVNGMIDLGTLGGDLSVGFAINGFGSVLGRSLTRKNVFMHGLLWVPNSPGGTTGVMLDLRPLGGGKSAEPRGLNANRIVGWSRTASDGYRAVMWTGPGNPTALGQLPGWFNSRAHAINSLGLIAGMGETASEPHPALWTTPNQPVDLGTLPGIGPSVPPLAAAWGINEDGWVVGAVGGSGERGLYHAFIWTPQDGMIELPELEGNPSTCAFGINGTRIVGMSGAHAVMWTVTPVP